MRLLPQLDGYNRNISKNIIKVFLCTHYKEIFYSINCQEWIYNVLEKNYLYIVELEMKTYNENVNLIITRLCSQDSLLTKENSYGR